MIEAGIYRYSICRLGQIMLDGAFEVIGQEGLSAVNVSLSHTAATKNGSNGGSLHASDVQEQLELHFGVRGSHGIALRAGRTAYQMINCQYEAHWLKEESEYRFLPMQARLLAGLENLAHVISTLGMMSVQVRTSAEGWVWRVQSCPLCRCRTSDSPCCHFMVGMLQACLDWTSGGKSFDVVETSCQAAGDPLCEFIIARQSLG